MKTPKRRFVSLILFLFFKKELKWNETGGGKMSLLRQFVANPKPRKK